MSKYTWDDMEMCKSCHYAKKDNPDVCCATGEEKEKPGTMIFPDDCRKYLRESKWKRMNAVYQELKKDKKAGKLTPYTRQILKEYEKYCDE